MNIGLFSRATEKDEKKAEKEIPEKLTKDEREEREEVKQFLIDQYSNHPLKGMEQMKRAYFKAFVDGYHYMQIAKEEPNKLTRLPKEPLERYRSKINNIRRNQLISVAKIMKDEPILRAVPSGNSIEDIKTARISNAIFDNLYAQNEIDLTNKNYGALKIANTQGTAWYKIKWNPRLADRKGDFEITVHDDFEIYPDPTATNWWNMEWCIHAYLQDIYKLEQVWPKLKGRIKEWKNNPDHQDRNIYTPDHYYSNTKAYQGKAFVLEFISRAGGRYPKGKKMVLINMETVAMYGNNPLHEWGYYFSMPIVPLVWDYIPNSLHGRSAVEDQIPINKEINKICSMTMENIRRTAAFKMGLPRGSSKAQDVVSDKVQVFYYNPDGGGKPDPVQVPSMPSYVSQYLSFLTGTQQDMAGIHEVSMGQLPERGSQMSGSALKLLQDSEMVSHSPVMRSMKTTLGIVGQFALKFVQKYYIEERILNFAGEGRRHEVLRFKNSDLNGSVDVKLQMASAFNTSAAAKVEGTLSLYKEGIIQDAEKGSKSAKKVLQSLEFGQVEELYQLDSAHERRAQWVIDEMANNHNVPAIRPYDNLEIHKRTLEEYMMNPDFEERDDDFKNVFISRWQEIDARMKQQQPQQIPQEQGGTPADGGEQAMPQNAAEDAMMMAPGPPAGGGMPQEQGIV